MSADAESPSVFGADEQHEVEVDVPRWVRLARLVLDSERVMARYGSDVEMSLMFVDEPTIAELNARFLGGDGPTDVLSFPLDEELPPAGRQPDQGGRGPGAPGEPGDPPARSHSRTNGIWGCAAVHGSTPRRSRARSHESA